MKPSLNPFRAKAVAKQRYKISGHEFEVLLNALKSQGYRASIRGPHGTGKSTLLKDVANALALQGETVNWHYLNREMSRTQKKSVLKNILRSKPTEIHCLDGGETIGYFIWFAFLLYLHLRNRRLLATTHSKSPLKTLHKTQISPHTMLVITESLAGKYWTVDLKDLAIKTYAEHKGNCREVFRACYLYCSNI